MDTKAESWLFNLQVGICENCDWGFLVPEGKIPGKCPHCFRQPLSTIGENIAGLPNLRPAELYLPFELADSKLSQVVKAFVDGIPFSPQDLSARNLLKRLERLYLPVWLVDCRTRATWQAEVGFDYEVVSHQDHFMGGKWISKQVNEVRIRWESRLGRLDRQNNNIQAAALEEHHSIIKALGQFAWQNVQSYKPEIINIENIRLPNRSPEDAWSDVEAAIQTRSAEECCKAASAGHIRGFTWQPEFLEPNWTLLLFPVLSSYYIDDTGSEIPVILHGQTGRIAGTRRASMKRAKSAALTFLLGSAGIFILSLLVTVLSATLPVLLALAVIGIAMALLLGLGSIIPVAAVWWFNRSQQPVRV